jgi:hypothetical protein
MAAFVLDATGDLMAFASAGDAAAYLEAVDVVDGEYRAAWLHDGTVLRMLTPSGDDGPVVLERTGDVDLAGLHAAVAAHAHATGRPGVGDLPAYADELIRWEREHRWPRRPRWPARRRPGGGPSPTT